MATRALVHLPKTARRGEIVEIRATLAHAMETGYRRDSEGRMLPRDIVRRIECRYDGELVFAADWFPAIAANPFVAFSVVAAGSAPIEIRWTGDNGFAHRETVTLTVA
jgi:sulfur-oxidizing protein SoxZ